MHKCGAGKQVNDVNFGSAAIKRGCKSSTYQKNVEKKLQAQSFFFFDSSLCLTCVASAWK